MPVLKKSSQLKKELRLIDVYAIATGTTLSAGFFLLPGLAAKFAGPAMILAYLLAAVPLIPATFSIIELSTAMPRAGGVYYFLDRTLGPVFGTIGGIGTWCALVLKVAFALVGMGTYIGIFIPGLPVVPIAVGLAIALGVVNIFGAKRSGQLQLFLVIGLLFLLMLFIGKGFADIDYSRFTDFFGKGFDALISTTGIVYISYVGVTKVASLSEEIRNPERNIPLGVLLALGTAMIIYALGTTIMVGVLPMEELAGSITPVADAGRAIFGFTGAAALAVAALLAFTSVANAGTMSASRYPMAMSRDYLLPHAFHKLSKHGMPHISIIVTVGALVAILIFLNPTGIAKLASAFQLLMFALVCLAVIVMRESRIESYDPGFRSPFYPWMQIMGILAPMWLIYEMGIMPIAFSVGIIIVGIVWHNYYAKDKVARCGAIYHIFERLGRRRYEGLDRELRGILKEKGLREEDPFDSIISRSLVIDFENEKIVNYTEILGQVGHWMSQLIPLESDEIRHKFLEGTRLGATPVTHGVALPHFRLDSIDVSELVIVRSRTGIAIELDNPLSDHGVEEATVFAIFFLVSPEKDPAQHLRILAQIAGRVDDDSFAREWFDARNEHEIKEAVLHDDRFLSFVVSSENDTQMLAGKALREITIPEGGLVAMIRRHGQTLVPKGNTVLHEGDRVTFIGDQPSLAELRRTYLRE
ncbi:MAG: amino acid permease [Candidatus Kapaibacterium sp.]